MDNLETFEQFLTSGGSTDLSIWNYIFNILLTALLSYLLGYLYDRYGNSLSNRKSFRKNFVVLAVTTMIIITIVKSSLALSLGLVGALSIVRFRTAIKEPEELTYLFLNIAIGLGFGANQKLATILGFILIAILIVGKNIIYKKENYDNKNLFVILTSENPVEDQMISMVSILEKYCTKVDLKRFDENKTTLEISFVIEVKNFNQINNMKESLQKKNKDISISFIDNNMVI
jgi:hypothetical protein